MEAKGKVVLVHREDVVFGELCSVLEKLGLEVFRAADCKGLTAQLQCGSYLTVFTEASLPDGEYRDVCRIASQPADPLPVIVVAPFVDLGLYLDSMENGASDFIVPPFLCTDIAHVLMTALSDRVPRNSATYLRDVGVATASA